MGPCAWVMASTGVEAEQMREADMDRRAMYRGEPGRDLHGTDGLRGPHRTHGDDHRSTERPRRRAGDTGPAHRYAPAGLNVADRTPTRQQRLLERKRAADHKR